MIIGGAIAGTLIYTELVEPAIRWIVELATQVYEEVALQAELEAIDAELSAAGAELIAAETVAYAAGQPEAVMPLVNEVLDLTAEYDATVFEFLETANSVDRWRYVLAG